MTGWSRCTLLGALVLAAVHAATARPDFVPGWDHAFYLGLARNLAEGAGYTLQGLPHVKYPPGLSALLAPVVAVSGSDPGWISMASCAVSLLAVGLVARWTARVAGRHAAAFVTVLFALNWQTLLHVPVPLSELPFVGMVLLAVAALDRWLRSGRGTVPAALAVLAAFSVRVVGLVLAPALLVAWVVRARTGRGTPPWPRAIALLLLATAPMAGWFLRNAWVRARSPAVAEENLSYEAELLLDAPDRRRDRMPDALESAAVLLGRLPAHSACIATAAADLMTGQAPETAPAVARVLRAVARALCLLLVGLGWFRSLRRGSVAEPYLLLYLGVLLVWPWPELMHRFLLPVLPFLFLYLWRGVRRVLPGLRPATVALALGGVLLAGQARSAWHAWHQLRGEGQRHATAQQACAWLSQHTPDDAVLASEWAAWLHWQTRRPVRFVQIRPAAELLADVQGADFLVVSSDDRGRLRGAVALAPERFTTVAEFAVAGSTRWWILRPAEATPRPAR